MKSPNYEKATNSRKAGAHLGAAHVSDKLCTDQMIPPTDQSNLIRAVLLASARLRGLTPVAPARALTTVRTDAARTDATPTDDGWRTATKRPPTISELQAKAHAAEKNRWLEGSDL